MPLELNPEIYRCALEASPIGVCLVDRERRIVFWNTRAERITGYLGQEVIGHSCHDHPLMQCDRDDTILCESGCPLAQTMQDGRNTESDVFLRHNDGQRVPVHARTVPIRDEFGAILGSAAFFDRHPVLASSGRGPCAIAPGSRDEKSDLPDSQAMRASLRSTLDEFTASGRPFGVLCVAIDNVEHLRHADGLQAVHEVQYAVGKTLACNLRPDDVVGCWQEERFLALIACPAPDALLSCAERLKRLVGFAAVRWWGDRLSVTVCMGGTMVRTDDTVESLERRAGEALEASLLAGPDSVLVV